MHAPALRLPRRAGRRALQGGPQAANKGQSCWEAAAAHCTPRTCPGWRRRGRGSRRASPTRAAPPAQAARSARCGVAGRKFGVTGLRLRPPLFWHRRAATPAAHAGSAGSTRPTQLLAVGANAAVACKGNTAWPHLNSADCSTQSLAARQAAIWARRSSKPAPVSSRCAALSSSGSCGAGGHRRRCGRWDSEWLRQAPPSALGHPQPHPACTLPPSTSTAPTRTFRLATA